MSFPSDMFRFSSTSTTKLDDFVCGCNSEIECEFCEDFDEVDKDRADDRKNSFLYLDVCFDSMYNHHLFKRSITHHMYSNKAGRPSCLSAELITPMKILKRANIPATVPNINSMYSATLGGGNRLDQWQVENGWIPYLLL